nr:hypothetical protein CFP56_66351 [Quercus suber]
MTTVKDKTLSGLENLNRVLPTGSVFLYMLLSPVLTNYGQCSKTIYEYLTATLVANTLPALGPVDFVHGFLAVFVFGVIVCLDRNTVDCFYPLSESQHRVLLEVLPPVVGAISSVVLLIFPNKRRGIGYHSLSNTSRDENPRNDSNSGAEIQAVTRTSEIPAVTRTEGSISVVSVVSCICR